MRLTIALIIAGSLIGTSLYMTRGDGPADAPSDGANVSIENGIQYIDISAKGGYSPRVNIAQAGIPTKIRMETSATFDCSASLTIPSIKYREILPPSGTTEIDVPPQEAGTVLQGLCSMGMYSFTIKFEEAPTAVQ